MMPQNYLLDTNIITYLQDQNSEFHPLVKARLSCLHDDDVVYVSALSFYEIEYGIAISDKEDTKRLFTMMKQAIQRDFPILPFTEKGSEIFGHLKAEYMKQTGISKKAVKRHDIDFMLASSAIVERAILISNDGIFEQLRGIRPDFRPENWTHPYKHVSR